VCSRIKALNSCGANSGWRLAGSQNSSPPPPPPPSAVEEEEEDKPTEERGMSRYEVGEVGGEEVEVDPDEEDASA
jgi:hypothetical protein